jgi:hypothetical protein
MNFTVTFLYMLHFLKSSMPLQAVRPSTFLKEPRERRGSLKVLREVHAYAVPPLHSSYARVYNATSII